LFVPCRRRISTPSDGRRVARPYTIASSSPVAYPNSAIPIGGELIGGIVRIGRAMRQVP
jgi:hypothetical protein